MKKDQYFPHEVNLRQTSEFMHLIEKEGIAGYGIYWGIIEYLRSQDDYIGDLRVMKALAYQLRTTINKLEKVLKNYGLFEISELTFHSLKLLELMEPLEKKRHTLDGHSSEGRARVTPKSEPNSLKISDASVTVKKSKEEKSKIKESKEEKKKETSSAEEVKKDEAAAEAIFPFKLPWEVYVDEPDKEQQWKGIMAQLRSPPQKGNKSSCFEKCDPHSG